MIKQLIRTTLLLTSLLFVGCDAFRTVTTNKVSSQGAPYELIVVCNQPEWESSLGDSLRVVLSAEIPYLAQEEPYFNVLRVTASSYNNLVAKHRNIMVCVVDPALEETSMVVEWNVAAEPQIVATLQGATVEDMAQYVGENSQNIRYLFESAERDRSIYFAERFSIESLDRLIETKFGVKMNIPQGYTFRSESEDFLWISHEYPTASQGLIIYSYPAQGSAVEALSEESLLAARNRFVKRVPGPSDGSFMSTYMEIEQDYRAFRLEGRLWVEMRGLWDVEGDFMGGPYVNYSTLDTESNRVFSIDMYVYSPKLGKRNFLRALEHLLYSVEIPQ